MSKIIIDDLTFYYAKYYQPVFEHVNLNLDTEWKLGLIGRNGRGKTTFLHLLNQTLSPNKGHIRMDVATELFPYQVNVQYHKTMDIIKENIGGLKTLEVLMDEILRDNVEKRIDEYQQLLESYLEKDGYNIESRIRKEVNLMKLPEALLERDYASLSGGEKTKLQIITLFLRQNAFVLLDEPTNHLDIRGTEVLIAYLQRKKGFIVVSHDREFLDQVIDHVLSINKTSIELEKGDYSSWKSNKDWKEAYEFRTRTKLEKEISALEGQSVSKRKWASLAEGTKNEHGKFERSSGSRAAQFMMHAKNAELEAEKNLRLKKDLLKNYEMAAELTINQAKSDEALLIKVKHLMFEYSHSISIIKNLCFEVYSGDRIWIKGANGSGKSTLLKLLSGSLPSKDSIEYANDLVIAESYQEPLWKDGFLLDHVGSREELLEIMEFCQLFDISHDTLKRPIDTFSGGETRKLDIARAFSAQNQLILLDEPLNYMDVYFREQLEIAILRDEPTIIFVEHDERFGKNVANKVIELG